MGWKSVQDKLDGLTTVQHAVLTFAGTWAQPGTGYPSMVVAGLNAYVNDDLCYEVPVPYPASFGPIGGPATSPSYQQSIAAAIEWAGNWIVDNPLQTFGIWGYSQGAEAASRVAIELMGGSLAAYAGNFIGGGTHGNPCRGAGFHAPGIADPGGHGISSVNMTELPTRNGQVVWADYVHSPANSDAGLDMYASVPNGQVGQDMTDVYTAATSLQFNDIGALTDDMVNTLVTAVKALGLIPAFEGGISGLLGAGLGALEGLLIGLVSGPQANATGTQAAVEAALQGIDFLAAPGGPTAPHISYIGEIAGYSNLVAQAVGFLNNIATLTPATAAA
jgi:hypothetical protein